MEIAIVGLGLIGGSLCKSIKKYTKNQVYGYDIDKKTEKIALDSGIIDESLDLEKLKTVDITFVCLYPNETVDYVKRNINNFKQGSIICDVCGVKKYIEDEIEDIILNNGLNFVGTHPMAGREFSGLAYSDEKIFEGASFIIAKTQKTSDLALEKVKKLALGIGFGRVVETDPIEHDRIIAYTSQLAHVISNAYVKSPELSKHRGFSAGSFQDLTRVAKLNETMWSRLFMLNKEDLLLEMDILINNLNQYKDALENEDEDSLKELLRKGRELKEASIE